MVEEVVVVVVVEELEEEVGEAEEVAKAAGPESLDGRFTPELLRTKCDAENKYYDPEDTHLRDPQHDTCDLNA